MTQELEIEQPPDAEPERRTAWSPLDAVGGVVLVAVLTSMVGAVVLGFTGEDGVDATLGLQAVLEASLVGIAVGYASFRGAAPVSRALGLVTAPRAWPAKVAAAFGAYFVFTITLSALAGAPEQTDVADELGFDESIATAIIAGALIVLIVPFCEEIFFRGFFFAGLRQRLPFAVAAVGSALLFGLAHLSDANLVAGVQLAVFGVILAWLYETTGSLWPSISLHVLNNAIAFTVLVTT